MKDIKLSQLNPAFRVSGSDTMRSLRLKRISVHLWPEPVEMFMLLVLDEKDVPIYRQVLHSSGRGDSGAIVVDKAFAFYDHLSVLVTTEPEGVPFSVAVTFE